MVIYILTKFGDDWLISADARVLTSKLWMDRRMDGHRQTVSDHYSSLSTLCSGELKIHHFSDNYIFYQRRLSNFLYTKVEKLLFGKG